jgi:hypothetical protein
LNHDSPSISASSPRVNPCFGTDPNIAALNVLADDGHSYLLPYAQFLYAQRDSNPALEEESDAPPEKLLIRFAVAQITVTGAGLSALEHAIQRQELKFVKAADRRLAATLIAHVAAVSVSYNQEVA